MSEPVVGIDLGTTNSAVATVEGGRARVIPSRTGGRLTPSVVGFTPAGARLVGEAASRLGEEYADRLIWAAKRFLGRRYGPEVVAEAENVVTYRLVPGPHGDIRVDLDGAPELPAVPLTQVSAAILSELKADAEAYLRQPVRKAVITVPANFDDGQRQATREAAEIAGLEVLRLVNEPTAAAVAYGLGRDFQGRALVFDLGGGTFDVSILELRDGVFEVLATGGDSKLGGEDFDARIVQWLLAQVDPSLRDVVEQDVSSMRRLKIVAEAAKRQLTIAEEALLTVEDLGDHERPDGPRTTITTALTRSFFETLSDPLSRRCLDVCEELMRSAGLGANSMDAVLLVGGMTRVPLIRRLVSDFFGRTPSTGVHPEEVVALGAAIHADELAQQTGRALLIDVTGHSLGVEVAGGRVRRLIDKNTTVPVSATEVFLPGSSGQRTARIKIVQGESDWARECTALGEVILRELPRADRGDVPLEVVFELTADGTLSVQATSLPTGHRERITVEARAAMPPDEVRSLASAEAARQAAGATGPQAEENFRHLVDRAERFLKVLQQGLQENPSEDALGAVSRADALIRQAHALIGVTDGPSLNERAELGRRLAILVGAR